MRSPMQEAPGQQRLRQVHRGCGAPDADAVHQGRRRGGQAAPLGLVRRPGSNRGRLQDRVPQAPFQVGIVVYQLAKLRMLEFYYDFLDYFLDRRDFELIQMDTDSMYFALAYDKLEEAIKPERRKEFEQEKKEWLSWDKWSNREPGLFKLEKEGTRAIALCSKCYFVEDEASGQSKCPPRASTRSRTSCVGSGTRELWRATRTWPQTGASECTKGPCTRTSNANWAFPHTTTSAGCWRTASTRSRQSSTRLTEQTET